jgi:hypothetical protein
LRFLNLGFGLCDCEFRGSGYASLNALVRLREFRIRGFGYATASVGFRLCEFECRVGHATLSLGVRL